MTASPARTVLVPILMCVVLTAAAPRAAAGPCGVESLNGSFEVGWVATGTGKQIRGAAQN